MFTEHSIEIASVINNYFQGIFTGNTTLLESVFHPQALLFGSITGEPYCKNLQEYLEGVQNRKSPYEIGESFRMKILSIEVMGFIAYAKLLTPMFEFFYYDYLALSNINGKWVIVNKLFSHDNSYTHVVSN